MRISEVAKRSGLSIHTIRFYEKYGLLDDKNFSRSNNNYRDYNEEILEILNLIKFGQKVGFRLPEIKHVIKQEHPEAISKDEKIKLLKDKLTELEERKRDIGTVCSLLKKKIHLLEDSTK